MDKEKRAPSRLPRDFIVGVIISLAVTFVARILNVIYTEISSSSSVFVEILDTVVFVFDSIIYAAGVALVIHFIRLGKKRYVRMSLLFVLLILALDYTASFLIDLLTGNMIEGLELFGVVYLLLNFAARALTYALLIWFAPAITRHAPMDGSHFPIISRRHPVSRMTAAAALFHMAPYFLFEIYSNISGIVEYGFNMTGSDILSILSAYGEIILIDGALTYLTVYAALAVLALAGKKNSVTEAKAP